MVNFFDVPCDLEERLKGYERKILSKALMEADALRAFGSLDKYCTEIQRSNRAECVMVCNGCMFYNEGCFFGGNIPHDWVEDFKEWKGDSE